MKKLLILSLGVIVCFCFSGCQLLTSDDSENLEFHENAAYDSEMIDEDNDSFIFTWLSYMEIQVTDVLKEKNDYCGYAESLFLKMKQAGVTDCFVQVRPFADALYSSEIFPQSRYSQKADFDVLRVITDVAAKHSIKVHAWVNPYRLCDNTADKKPFSEEQLRQRYGKAADEIITTPSGMFFNPSALCVQQMIIDGARELLENYDLQGIHIDDYFYPPDMYSADEMQFEAYRKNGGRKALAQWRRENVSNLVRSLYIAVKEYGEEKIFSISPSGNIDKNENQLYADVRLWCSEEGYCDIILPQLYFGFLNSSQPFEKCLDEWMKLCRNSQVKLIPGLALYKRGISDEFAGEAGRDEWVMNDDVIQRQIKKIKDEKLGGFALYSASYINFSETF